MGFFKTATTRRLLLGVGLMATSAGFLGATGCLGSDEEAPATFAEPCDGDCAEGLECTNGLCTAACPASACTAFSSTAICADGYCLEPCPSFNCPNGLACTQSQTTDQMTCRAR